jgi:hypothetical protein
MTLIQVSTSHDYTIIDGPGNHSKYKPEELFTHWALFKAKIYKEREDYGSFYLAYSGIFFKGC